MKVADIHQLRSGAAAVLQSGEPVVVTRRGKVSGLYVPLDHPEQLHDDMHRELARVLGGYLRDHLDTQGVTEEKVLEDFHAYRRSRR